MVRTERVEGLGVADVIDAMMVRFQHKAHIIHLQSPDPRRILLGPAITIAFMPVRNDLMDPFRHSFGPAFYRALGEEEPAGKVLVMASSGQVDISLGGGTKLSRVQNQDLAGILCDGHLRDFDELNTFNFATYCKGETVHPGGGQILPYLSNVPVCVSGVTVVPGDMVFAVGTSAVILPGEEAETRKSVV